MVVNAPTSALTKPRINSSILPSLIKVRLKGAREYLEVLAQIDTPQFFQLTSRGATLRTPEKGHITFNFGVIFVGFLSHISDYYAVLSMRILCTASQWYCTPLSTLKDLYIFENRVNPPLWQLEDEVELKRL